ncbi:MAG: lysophospholipase [Candidatus Omnitrophica bacterium]|nr:lysophospholipase [Candidatus Omnitrophota bacterium]
MAHELAVRQWPIPSAQKTIIIVHGGGEHAGRYEETARRLNREGFSVVAPDLRGHGRSPGQRGHILRFEEYLEDVSACLQRDVPPAQRPPILLGHSLGGLVCTYYAMAHPSTIRCLVLSSPLWGLNVPVPAWKHQLACVLSTGWPSFSMRRPVNAGEVLSHDPQVKARYLNDPLVHFKVSCRFYTEMRTRLEQLPQGLPRLTVPVLVLQAGDDRVASAEATRRLFPFVGSAQKRLIVYDGFYHEILNEVDKARVLQDLVAWLRTNAGVMS